MKFIKQQNKMKKYFWARPMYLPNVHEPLTNEVLAAFEQNIGYKLPPSLVALLKIQNGGLVRYGALPTEPLPTLRGIGNSYPMLRFLEKEIGEDWANYLRLPLNKLLVLESNGAFYTCLDYRHTMTEPQVIRIDVERNVQMPLAGSFTQFIQGLKLETEGMWVVKSEKTLEEVVNAFKKMAGVEFEHPSPGTFYPLYWGRLDDYQLCLSPNKVAFAVAANGKKIAHQAKGYFCDIAQRYPEIDSKYSLLLLFEQELIPLLTARLGSEFAIVSLAKLLEE